MASPDVRPDPDELLRRVKAAETRDARAKLKIFFGFAPGVGKTYRMLQSARELVDQKVDVVVGVVETHGRYETAALTLGLEMLPKRKLEHRGRELEEFDLDAALTRKPEVLLVDELAHSNVSGSRHTKRWQDVQELLDAGIEVHTTVNVQHLESLNDVVAQVTGVQVRETVPDAVLERADEVELVDVSIEELLERLREGKVYVPDQAARALHHFFQPGNLLALRELALLNTARRVDLAMQTWRLEHGHQEKQPIAEHILVCVGPSPMSALLVRAAKRMAAGLRATWTVATVETPVDLRMTAEDRERVARHLALAERLGARLVTLHGDRLSQALLEFAHREHVTRIVIGKPTHRRWRDLVFGSVLEEVVRGSGHIDVHVISGPLQAESDERRSSALTSQGDASGYFWALLLVVAATGLGSLLFGSVDRTDIVTIYMLAIVIVSLRYGRLPSVLTSVLSVAAFDLFFVPPRFTFAVADARFLLTFSMMLGVGLVIGTLAARVRRQAVAADVRERRTGLLYNLTRDLAGAKDSHEIASSAVPHLTIAAGAPVALLLPDAQGQLRPVAGANELAERERAVAAWTLEHGKAAGAGTDTLSGSKGLYLPLRATARTLGVLAVQPSMEALPLDLEQRQLLDVLGRQTAMAIERGFLVEAAEGNRARAEREELRSTLLSSVSHDLRTPLAAITGASSMLLALPETSELERELLQTVFEEATRLNRFVSNLLDMTKLESGRFAVKKEWTPLEEVIGAALNRLDPELAGRDVTVQLAEDLPLVAMDGVLMEQAFFNLLENTVKHTPKTAPLEIRAWHEPNVLLVEICDRGPGFAAGSERYVFDKFFRAPGSRTQGAGLGLAITRAIVTAHGGTISAENREGGGARFRLRLPLEGTAPRVASEFDAVPAAEEPTLPESHERA